MPLLEVRGITKVFARLTALRGVDLTVADNEFHGLIGPNGSGKSTLMKCIAGAEMPTEGISPLRRARHHRRAARRTRPCRAQPEISDPKRTAGAHGL